MKFPIHALLGIAVIHLSSMNLSRADWIIPVGAVATSEQDANDVATKTIDGSGLSAENASATHAAANNVSWSMRQGDGTLVGDEHITFDLGDLFDLTSAYVWQFTRNDTGGDLNRGVRQYDILVAGNDAIFTEVVSDALLNKAIDANLNNLPDGNEPAQIQPLVASGVRYVRFGIDLTYENRADRDWQGGFGEVRFEGTSVVPEPSILALLGLGGVLLLWRR